MDWKQHITRDPEVLHGADRFAGTRIPVTMVLDNLADGATPAEILSQFPGLRAEHVAAALAYAAGLARERVALSPALDPELLDHALRVSGEPSQRASVHRAVREFIARREQRRVTELFGTLEWDAVHDHKAERAREP